MLSVNTYPRAYIAQTGARFEADLAVVEKTGAHALLPSVLIALDAHFAHRARGLEKKDGNPCNELRMLTASLLAGSDVLLADKTIKYDAARSVLGLAVGAPIRLDMGGSRRLAKAFLADLDEKYGADA
jgi:hypothetical protein